MLWRRSATAGLVDAVARVSPDAIVTDISMPFLDGIEAHAKSFAGTRRRASCS